ncbi:MAG: hypothetical protein MRZ79_08690 [Bacteroidia bacterium]|nr:hypothetical protein [Bacteroidia bacterium]
MKFHILFFALSTLLLTNVSFAQQGDTNVGFRLGSGAGLSVKYMCNDQAALEGILMYRRGGVRAVGLVKAQFEIGRSNTYFFIGAGGHAGVNRLFNPERPTYQVIGLDGIVGLEYHFPYQNLIFSVDLKPMVEILQDWNFSGNSGALTLRVPLN